MSGPDTHVIVRAPSRRPKLPTVFYPSFAEPEIFTGLTSLVERLSGLAGDNPLSLCMGAATYPGFDTFPSVTVYAGGHWIATVALPGITADTAREALARDLGLEQAEAA